MSVDHRYLVSSTEEAAEMTDLGSNNDQTKKKPKYFEGVYMNERTISTNGDVTPSLLRSPISRGLFNLPRYVPKYTINSRLHGNYSGDTLSDSKTSRTFDRKYTDDKDVDSNYFREVPIYRDSPVDDVLASTSGEVKESRRSKGRKKSKKNAESKQRKACCCSECCSVKCCTPKCRRCACIFFIVVLIVVTALLALALGLYFGYFMQFGDPSPMKANFTVTNAVFPAYLLDLSNTNTINLTSGICRAFERTLENVSQILVRVSSCSAVSYMNGSVNAIFNIHVSHRRDEFTNSGDAFSNAVINRVKGEFQLSPSGYFAEAVSNSLSISGDKTGSNFNLVLNEIASGHFSLPITPSTTTVASTSTTTRSIAIRSSAAIKTTPKNSVTSTGKGTGTNTGNVTASGNNARNSTGGATTSGRNINTTPSVTAISCGNNTGVNTNVNQTNCGNNIGVTGDSVLNTTVRPIASITMKITAAGPTSTTRVSSSAKLPSSVRTDSSTTMRPVSTNVARSSSTQNPTTKQLSTQGPTTKQLSTQGPTTKQLSTQDSTTKQLSTQGPTTKPSSTQSATVAPSSTKPRTTTVLARTSPSTLHLAVTTTATPSATTLVSNVSKATN